MNNTMFVPQRWFNAYRGPRDDAGEIIPDAKVNRNNTAMPGDINLHFAGKPSNKDHMETFLRKAELHEPEWEVPFDKTRYPTEIRDFWDKARKQKKERESGKYSGKVGSTGRPS